MAKNAGTRARQKPESETASPLAPAKAEVLMQDDAERLRALLIELNGNITKAAERLRVDSAFLRGFVDRIPRLRLTLAEIMERGVDQAVDILYEGLGDQASFQNRFYSAKEMLKSDAGRRRGYGQPATHNLEIKPVARGSLEIKWIDPPKHDLEGPLIEHEEQKGEARLDQERKDHEGDR